MRDGDTGPSIPKKRRMPEKKRGLPNKNISNSDIKGFMGHLGGFLMPYQALIAYKVTFPQKWQHEHGPFFDLTAQGSGRKGGTWRRLSLLWE